MMTKSRLLPAQRTQKINPFRVMDVLEQAKALELAGHDIIHLEVGEPDFTTALPVCEAAMRSIAAGHTAYTPASGLPQLRERIAEYYRQQHGVNVARERILVTPGASGALVLLANLLLNAGDKVLMPDPAYPCNRNYVHMMGAQAVLIPPAMPGLAAPTVAQLDAVFDDKVKGIWLASPVNPTGAVIDADQLQTLSDWARARGVHLLMDEIYHGLDFVKPAGAARSGGDLPTALGFDAENFVVNSFSKYFGMTGWRVGWLVVPESLVTTANILAQNLFIAAATPSQFAALRAMDDDVIQIHEQRRAAFRERRDFLAAALRSLGFELPWQPDGAFYCYAAIDRFGDDCELFCQRMLSEQGIALTPGTDFGQSEANRYVRFAYTRSLTDLERAAERMQRALLQW